MRYSSWWNRKKYIQHEFLGPVSWKFSGPTSNIWKGSPVFSDGMFQTEMRVPLMKSHLWYQFQAFAAVFRWRDLICANSKYDSGIKFTSTGYFGGYCKTFLGALFMTLLYESLIYGNFLLWFLLWIPFGRLNKVYCIVLYLIILCILITSVNQLGWLSSEERRPEKISRNRFNLYT